MRKIHFLIFLLLPGLLCPQEGESPPSKASPFPLGPVLAEAACGDGRWRPDWPAEIAPDAFTVKGEAAAVTVELAGVWEAGGGAPQAEAAAAEPGAPASPGAGPAAESAVRGPRYQDPRYRGVSYRLARDSAGRLSSFPMALGLAEGAPVFVQVEVRREEGIRELRILVPALPEGEPAAGEVPSGKQPAGEPSRVSAGIPAARTPAAGTPASATLAAGTPVPGTIAAGTMAIAGSASSLGGSLVWSVQFLDPYLPGMPSAAPVKVQAGEELYYVLFSGGGDRIAETWYDPWGNFAAYFETRIGPEAAGFRVLGLRGKNFNRDYSYESGGNLSECSGDRGLFSAVYGGRARPLYWKAGREYGLSWDEEGLLTGMRDLGPAPSGEGPFEGSFPAAFRYEYEFDSRGNWIRRREIGLFLRENLLVPELMRETVRQIDYPGED